MLYPDLLDVAVETFGGYAPAIPPAQLPPGAAQDVSDCVFPMAAVRTRGGLDNAVLTQTAGDLNINGLKSFITAYAGSGGLIGGPFKTLLLWDSAGNFQNVLAQPGKVFNIINSRHYQNLLYESQTLFSREYQCFFNQLGGFDIPRQWDGNNWDRVSHSGPGLSATVADISYPIASISRAATTGVITVTLGLGYGSAIQEQYVIPGQFITIAGVQADPTLDGQFPIQSVASASGGTETTVTCWGNPGTYDIVSIKRTANVVVAVLNPTPPFAGTAGVSVVITGVTDDSFDGEFTTVALGFLPGNSVTWDQTGPNSISAGGQLYVETVSSPILVFQQPGYDGAANNPSIALPGNQLTLFPAGSTVVVSGNSVAAYNQSYTVGGPAAVYYPNGAPGLPGLGPLTVIYLTPPSGSFPAGAGTGGTATYSLPASSPSASGMAGPTGHISEGLHQISVAYINRQSWISIASVPISWNAQGNFLAQVSTIPTGPANITQRLLLFTAAISPPATTGAFYSLPTGSTQLANSAAPNGNLSVMLIQDNATTSAIVDFADAILIAGFSAEYLFTQLEIGEPSCFLPYNARTVFLGERDRVPNFVNLGFDGGFSGVFPNQIPNGWTADATYGAGGGSAVGQGKNADWGDAYAIVGDGVTAVKGKITQPAYRDWLLNPVIQPNTSYSVRIRVAGYLLSQGTLHVTLYDAAGSGIVGQIQVTTAAAMANPGIFSEYTAQICGPLLPVPTDLLVQVYVDGTPNNNGMFVLDSIEFYPSLTPVNSSTARFAHAFNPESFDSVTGQVQVRPGDGQSLQAGFPLRNNLYLAKDHYLGYVTDDGINEPSSWTFSEVSATIGICGPNAVDWNEEWATFAERSGLYICWGSDPVKISQEIETDASGQGKPNWSLINWACAYTIWVRIDRANKRILVGAPINGATQPNIVFVLDYQWLESAEAIASVPGVGYSQFTGKMLYHGKGRRWGYWNISANSMCFAEWIDGTAQPFFGCNDESGYVWQQVDASIQAYDVLQGVQTAINSYWKGSPVPSSEQEQMLQLGAHRKLCGYFKARVAGNGTLILSVSTALRMTAMRGYTLLEQPLGDFGRGLNIHGERFWPMVGTNAVGAWFQCERMALCLKKDAAVPISGLSS